MNPSYFSAIPSALIALNRALEVAFFNPAAEALLGISASQASGRPVGALPGFHAELHSLCERALASGEAISLFRHTLPIPLNHRIVTLHITPVRDESQSVEQLLLTIEKPDGSSHMNASEWKRESTRAAGVMAAMLAHEVKNPLSGIRGAAQLLKDEVQPEHQSLAELICMEADRIRDLLAQIDVFAEDVPAQLRQINIHEVLQYVLSIAQSGFATNVAFREHYDPSLPLVMGQRDQLVQLFLNLVKNAAEALAGRDNACITLSSFYRSGYRMRLDGQQPVPLPVGVAVEDNGPGISGEVREKLFEPFVSSKEDGRGLGLAVVARIAAGLGAVVELDPEFTQGTRFLIWLPCGE